MKIKVPALHAPIPQPRASITRPTINSHWQSNYDFLSACEPQYSGKAQYRCHSLEIFIKYLASIFGDAAATGKDRRDGKLTIVERPTRFYFETRSGSNWWRLSGRLDEQWLALDWTEKLEIKKLSSTLARQGQGWGEICAAAHQDPALWKTSLNIISTRVKSDVFKSFRWNEVHLISDGNTDPNLSKLPNYCRY